MPFLKLLHPEHLDWTSSNSINWQQGKCVWCVCVLTVMQTRLNEIKHNCTHTNVLCIATAYMNTFLHMYVPTEVACLGYR